MNDAHDLDSQERRIGASLKRELQRDADELDELTRARLSAARHRATAHAEGKWSLLSPWSLGAGLASIALLMIVLPNFTPPLVGSPDDSQLTTTATVLEDLNILAASDDVDFYQSVDFLLWLESNAGSEG